MTDSLTPPLPIKAVICAVYGVLLDLGPAPADAEDRWAALWQGRLRRSPRLSLTAFHVAADCALQADLSMARARGVESPAPYWPAVAGPLLPELDELSEDARGEFLYAHAQLRRSVALTPGADTTLRALARGGALLGLISNGGPHTPVELAFALHAPSQPIVSFIPPAAAHGVFHGAEAAKAIEIFTPPLCFWAFSHGFGKPHPHAFQHVASRLRMRGIKAAETLMVGASEANDLQPARRFGWRVWRLTHGLAPGAAAGDWPALARRLGLPASATAR